MMSEENVQNPEGAPDAAVPSPSSDASAAGEPSTAETPKNEEGHAGSEAEEIAVPWEEESSSPVIALPAELPSLHAADQSLPAENPLPAEPQPVQPVETASAAPMEESPSLPEPSSEVPEPSAEQERPQEQPFPDFDPLAAFLSAQSASGSPRLPERQDTPPAEAPSSPAAEEPSSPADEVAAHADSLDQGDDHPEVAYDDEEDDELEHAAAAPHYERRHPLLRAFNLFCWLLLLTFIGGVGSGFFYVRYARERLGAARPGDTREVDIVIQQGDSYRKVVARLKEAGLLGNYMGIDDAYLMRYLAWYNGDSSKIRHGAYRLSANASLSDIYSRLLKGSREQKLTVPEGLTVQQIADLAARQYDSFNPQRFVELTQDQAFITSLGMYVPSLEGYLLPNTYYFNAAMKEEDLIRLMVGEFRKAAEAHLASIEKKDDLTFHEHVILASLIEREARVDEDRPLIASVILNRIRKDMKLEIDATVNYALNEWRRLSFEDLKVDSPFNTYKIKGLPPAPICNPRIESLVASYTAPATDYLFYVHRGDGHHAFSSSYDDHQKNVKEFIKPRTKAASVPVSNKTGGSKN